MHSFVRLVWLLLVTVVVGCATSERVNLAPTAPDGESWTGRLVLKADTVPPTHFSAVFELKGSAEHGRLALSTPLGTTLAVVDWQPGLAELRATGSVKRFEDLDGLTEALTGTRLPVTALFAWLGGTHASANGWQADLSELNKGKLTAQRLAPNPLADIKLVLDRPLQLPP